MADALPDRPSEEPAEARRLPPTALLLVFLLSFPLSFLAAQLVRSAAPGVVESARGKLAFQLCLQAIQTAVALSLLKAAERRHGVADRGLGLGLSGFGTHAGQAIGGLLLLAPLLLLALLTTELIARAMGIRPESIEIARLVRSALSDPVAAWLLFGVAVVGAPVMEELLFRGLLFRSLRGWMPFWPAAAASSLLFAVMHGYRVIPLVQLILGLFFCRLYERTGSLSASMVAHSANNAAAYGLSVFLPRSSPTTALVVVLGWGPW